jgi:hypothetical protein
MSNTLPTAAFNHNRYARLNKGASAWFYSYHTLYESWIRFLAEQAAKL